MINIWLTQGQRTSYGYPYCRLVKAIDESLPIDPAFPSNDMQNYWPQRYHWQFTDVPSPRRYFGENESLRDDI